MSRTSTTSAGRTSKATAATRKKTAKSAKSARKSVKKPAASSRRADKPARRAAPARSASVEVVAKWVAVKMVEITAAPAVAAIMAEASIRRTLSPPVQPVALQPVHPHKYRVGETVYYTSPSFGRAAASGSYTVGKLLPAGGGECPDRDQGS